MDWYTFPLVLGFGGSLIATALGLRFVIKFAKQVTR